MSSTSRTDDPQATCFMASGPALNESAPTCVGAERLFDDGADDDQLVMAVGRYTIENLILDAVHQIGDWFRFDGVVVASTTGVIEGRFGCRGRRISSHSGQSAQSVWKNNLGSPAKALWHRPQRRSAKGRPISGGRITECRSEGDRPGFGPPLGE